MQREDSYSLHRPQYDIDPIAQADRELADANIDDLLIDDLLYNGARIKRSY